eukprot:809072_1
MNWGNGVTYLHKTWQTPKEECVWVYPCACRVFLDELTKYAECYAFTQIWKDRLQFYKQRWNEGLRLEDMNCLDTCLWIEHIMGENTKQYLFIIEELQTHFMNKRVTGKHLKAVKTYTSADIVMEFSKRIQLQLNMNKHKLHKEILKLLLCNNNTAAVDDGKEHIDLFWDRSYSVNMLTLLLEHDVDPFWNQRICHGIE